MLPDSVFLYPGAQFDVEQITGRLLALSSVHPHPGEPGNFFIAEQANAEKLSVQLEDQPDEPQWTVMIDLSPDRIDCWLEATKENLELAKPALSCLLELPIKQIEDQEGRLIEPYLIKEWLTKPVD